MQKNAKKHCVFDEFQTKELIFCGTGGKIWKPRVKIR